MSTQPLRLITETIHDVRALKESVGDGTGVYHIEGIFMQGNKKNQNGRIYVTDTLCREVERYMKEFVARKRAFGELGHPDNPTVNLDRVSHLITELNQDGDNFIGKAKITNTPMGNIVKALIDEGAELGVSSRGLGSLKETDRGMEVQEDFFFSTVDIVADPSAPDAFVRGIMEGKAWVWESGVLKECALDKVVQTIEAVHKPTVSADVRKQALVEEFDSFLTELRRGVRAKIK